ncbi:hypothetical protein [uncultured Sphingomonas sp.]|uniref:hypothetical protein n=1 Tax=uncultured Sphingomonas sp. TaxID=158754 RepID=UPI0035CC17CE
MARAILLLVAVGLAGAALLATVADPASWPMLAMALVLLTGIVFERLHYVGNATDAAAQDWRATGEKFLDEASGRLVTVWFNPTTGERDYRES